MAYLAILNFLAEEPSESKVYGRWPHLVGTLLTNIISRLNSDIGIYADEAIKKIKADHPSLKVVKLPEVILFLQLTVLRVTIILS